MKNILIFLASLAVASIALNTALSAGSGEQHRVMPMPGGPASVYCIRTTEELEVQVKQKGLSFLFSGITKAGVPLWFYRNEKGFTVFYRTPTQQYCTTPNFYGDIIETATEGYPT